jgi:carbonic anhydrase
MSKSKRFATVVNCMDGRVQLPVIEFMKKRFRVDFVDDVTEAGSDCILCSRSGLVDSIRKRVSISVERHGSRVVGVVGHFDCAGNPVSEKEHKKEIGESVKVVSKWFPGVTVVGLWVDRNWIVHEV